MKDTKGLFVLIYMLLLPLFSMGQTSDLGNWLIYIGNKKLDNKWNIHHEVQYRNYNAIGDLEQLLLRTGLGYSVTTNTNVLLGYGFIHSQNYLDASSEKVNVDEHRIFQQIITKQRVGKLGLQHRYRFEQRFVEDIFKLRYRYFLGLNIPIKERGDTNVGWYLSSYNEIFLNGSGAIFDRNRLYGGLGCSITKNLRAEVGYMNQFFGASSRDQINVLLFANF